MSDNNKSIIEQLREKNPFASLASPLPFNNNGLDFQPLNRETSDEIEQLLRQKRREPNVPLAGMIYGEPGSGKTHMLTRILRKIRNNASAAIFVAVRAFRDPESVTRHILNDIFISLKSDHSNGRTQFDVVASEVMNTYTERRRQDGFDSIANLDMKAYLAKDMPTLDKNFLKCFMLYITSNDITVKSNVLSWLNEGLDDDDALSLGLPMKNMDTMSDAKCESIAEKTIISLGTLLAYAKVPMLVCFDQLEVMNDDPKLIKSWGNAVAVLINELPGVLPLCFIRFDAWDKFFRPNLDEALVQRIQSNEMVMQSCTLQQAKQLIREKIAFAFNEGAEEKYKWLMSRMERTLTPKLSPRDVIELANRAITSPPGEATGNEIFRTIANAYADECRKVSSAPNMWPPSSEQLTLALEVWLTSHDGIELKRVVDRDRKYMPYRGSYEDKKIAFVIITTKNSSTAQAGSARAKAFIETYPDGKGYYITEAKTHKRTWKKAGENLKAFTDAGGYMIVLDDESRVKWYALTSLVNQIDSNNINLYISSQPRPATRDDIRDFVKSIDLLPGLFRPTLKKSPAPASISAQERPAAPAPVVVVEPDVLKVNLKGIISASPMNILAVDKAVELLANRRVNVTRNEILAFVKDNAEMFRTFRSKNDVLITFAAKK